MRSNSDAEAASQAWEVQLLGQIRRDPCRRSGCACEVARSRPAQRYQSQAFLPQSRDRSVARQQNAAQVAYGPPHSQHKDRQVSLVCCQI